MIQRLIIIALTLFCAESVFADTEKDAVQCPTLTAADISTLNQDRTLKNGAHTWYLHDMFELPETLGSHIPLDLSVSEVLKTKDINFKGQLDDKTCQYKATLEHDRQANLTFRLMGN